MVRSNNGYRNQTLKTQDGFIESRYNFDILYTLSYTFQFSRIVNRLSFSFFPFKSTFPICLVL